MRYIGSVIWRERKKKNPYPKPDEGGVGEGPRVWPAKSIYKILKEGSQLVSSHGMARQEWKTSWPENSEFNCTFLRPAWDSWKTIDVKQAKSWRGVIPSHYPQVFAAVSLSLFIFHWKLGACVSAGILCLSSKASRNEQLERVGKIALFFLYTFHFRH